MTRAADGSIRDRPPLPAWIAGLAFLLLCWPVLRMLVAVFEELGEYSHGYLVPLVAGYAAWHRREEWRALPPGSSPMGLLLLAASCLLLFLGLWHEMALRPGGLGSEFVCGTGAVLGLYGLHLALFGPARTRVFRFPLLFLFLAVPLPETLSSSVVLPSRALVSAISAKLIALTPVEVIREGNILHLPADQASLGIEDACSGIRSLWVLITSAIAIGYLMECRIRHVVIIGLLAFPLALAQNLLRVLCTALLVHYVNPSWAEGWKHEATGWLTFLIAASITVFLAAWWSARHPRSDDPPPVYKERKPQRALLMAAVALPLSTAAALAMVRAHYAPRVNQLVQQSEDRHPLRELPVRIGSYDFFESLELPKAQLDLLKPDDHYVAMYRHPSGRLFTIMLFYWNPQRLGAYDSTYRPHAPDICYPAAGWQALEGKAEMIPLDASAGLEAAARLFSQGDRDRAVIHWQNELPLDQRHRSAPGMLQRLRALVQSWNQASMILGRQYSVTVDTDAGADPDAAREAARHFAEALHRRLGPFDMQ